MTTVVNLKKEPYQIYIWRKNNAIYHFGNPFSHIKNSIAQIIVKDRSTAMLYFKQWINNEAWQEVEPERRKWILSHLYLLEDKILGCYCKPQECHGDIYIEILNKDKNGN